MYLKKMEMTGFKSFADKTVVEFESGISCIIGPNGSGKSNITDALRWVLGEQKVSLLRGNNMKDIIFSGTEFRKPLGRAEISLFFDNSQNLFKLDYDIVKITRRLFRSGESEYLINGTKTRLLDIRELIMDTGIGSDGYSIISQGKINEMITANHDEMRAIFEEAVGITKFKSRKVKSMRKLEKTTINLNRIEDLVYELQSRIEPLKKDSEKALEYTKYFDELKNIEMSVFSSRLQSSKSSEKTYNKKISDLYFIRDKHTNTLRVLKEKFSELKGILDVLNINISKSEEEFYESNGKIAETTNDLNINKERIENAKANLVDINSEINKMNIKIELLSENETEIASRMQEIDDEILRATETLINENDILKEKMNVIALEKENKYKINSKISELETLIVKNSGTIEAKESVIEQIKKNSSSSEDKKKEFVTVIDDNRTEFDYLTEVTQDNIKKINEITEERNSKVEILSNKNIILEQYENDKRNLERSIEKEKTELKLLNNYEENYIGYYDSVKKLMTYVKNNKMLDGVHGVVGALMQTEKKFELAIEISLGNAMQNVVCDNSNVAKKMINVLKKNNFGRVSFLPIADLFSRNSNDNIINKASKFPKFLGKADELIGFDEKYKKLFKHLLGNTLIVEDYDTAKEILKIENIRYKVVTLDGEVFSPGGRITGGSFKSKSKGLIGRKRKIEELDENIKKNIISKDKFVEKTEIVVNEVEAYQSEIFEFDSSISSIRNTIMKNDSRLSYLGEKYNDDKKQLDGFEKEIFSNHNEIKSINEEIVNLGNNSEVTSKEIIYLKDSLNEFIDNEVSENNLKNIQDKIVEIKIKIAASKEKKENYIFNKEKTIEEIKDYNNQIEVKKNIINSFSENIDNYKEKNLELDSELNILNELKENLQALVVDFKNKFSLREQELYKTEEDLEKINIHLDGQNTELTNLKVNKTKIDLEIEKIKEDLWEKYEVSYMEAIEYQIDQSLLEDSAGKIKKLRREIKKLGNVNLQSIEEYKEVSERYEHLSTQKNDLVKAIKAIEKIIKDLDGKMETLFKDGILNIRVYFKEIFKELFKGGEADIVIEDEENILDSSVNIMAQPPGKKLQNLNLLSGGEKALTAISLLFAILKNKPSPFCVLDEIEAALDDANVFRFAEYLKTIADGSQFIVITHRKGTMEVADCLYGVTMEEKGVSKIVSLKLEDINEDQY